MLGGAAQQRSLSYGILGRNIPVEVVRQRLSVRQRIPVEVDLSGGSGYA